MAKGLRSKTKRAFRTARRATVAQTPEQASLEQKRQAEMDKILEQGRAFHAARDSVRPVEPSTMDASGGEDAAAAAEAMETDARLALKKGKALGKGRRVKKIKVGISGSNQFHMLGAKGSKSKRKNKNNPGYTLATSY